MANNIAAFFETLIAGAGEYNAAKKGQTALLDCVYKDPGTEAGRIGKTIDVYFPDVGPMQNIGNGQLTGTSISPNFIPLVFQNRIGKGLQFQDFEQWQTASDLAKKFFDPLYKRAMEYMNGQVCSLMTVANFNNNAPIIGTTQGEVTVANAVSAWSTLADQKVPLSDPNMLHLAVHNRVHANMIQDSAWVQESLVGIAIAQEAREDGKLRQTFNFKPVWDQQMPTTSGSIIYGQVTLVNGSAVVNGQNTQFTSLTAGSSYLTFGSDAGSTQYLVQSISSDTLLNLSTTYAGTTPISPTTARQITVLTGTLAPTTASATVVGTSTLFTTQLTVGQWIVFASDATATPYQVLTITDATHIVLTKVIAAAANSSSTTGTVYQYTNLAFHEYAIALALRPIATPPEAARVVDVTYLDLMGIPLRVMVSYVHIYQALFVTVDYGYALGVIRPDFGVLIQT